jgi:hypothetical protein
MMLAFRHKRFGQSCRFSCIPQAFGTCPPTRHFQFQPRISLLMAHYPLISFPFIFLRTLLRSAKHYLLYFHANPDSLPQNTGGGIPQPYSRLRPTLCYTAFCAGQG